MAYENDENIWFVVEIWDESHKRWNMSEAPSFRSWDDVETLYKDFEDMQDPAYRAETEGHPSWHGDLAGKRFRIVQRKVVETFTPAVEFQFNLNCRIVGKKVFLSEDEQAAVKADAEEKAKPPDLSPRGRRIGEKKNTFRGRDEAK